MSDSFSFTVHHNELIGGMVSLMKSMSGFFQETTFAVQAYTRLKVLELKREDNPEVQMMMRENLIVKLKDEKKGMDKLRSRLFNEIRDNQEKLQKQRVQLYGENAVPVKNELKDGTNRVKIQPPIRRRDNRPLTHHMDLTKIADGEKKEETTPAEATAA